MFKPSMTLVALLLASSLCAASTSDDIAKATLDELRALVSEGTGVIGDLQPHINSGKLDPALASQESLENKLRARYQKSTSRSIDSPLPGLPGEARKAFLNAYRDVLATHRGVMTKGGQDAFVPAYFRAQVLKEFNKTMGGKVRAYATNRDNELINGDWAVARVMKGSPVAGHVTELMGTGKLDPVVTRNGDHMLGYWPMKLGASCVQCHAANGLQQKEGTFGGALVAEMSLK